MNNKALKQATLKALFWSFLERFSSSGVQFVFSIFMARILLPEDFGLIAMLLIFISFGQAFINSGFGQALIQKQNSNNVDENSIFYFNILMSFIMAGLIYLAAPYIANFYQQPELILMTRVLSLTFVFNSLGLVQRTLLIKELDFKTQLKISLLTTIISGIIGVKLALDGYGVWSLVALYLCNDFFNTAFVWFFSTWRPSFIFSLNSLKSMFGFGSRLLLVSLINSIFTNIYNLVIGKYFSATDLGFYSRANSLCHFPVLILNNVMSQVTFPVYSKISHDKELLKKAVSSWLIKLMFVVFPIMIGLIAVATPLVEILLTEKWLPIVPYMQLLCFVGILKPIQVINLNALNAQGHSNLFLNLEIYNKVLIAIMIAITFSFGITAMIYGQIIIGLIGYYLNAYYTGKFLEYPFFTQIKDMIPSFLIALIMGVCVFSINYISFSSQISMLSIQIISGIVIYSGLSYVFKISSFFEMIDLAKMVKDKFV